MNIVSNFIGSISPNMFGDGVKNAMQGINLDDTTFSDLLKKQLNNLQGNEHNFMHGLSFPAGINNIVNFDETGLNVKTGDNGDMLKSIKPINTTENTDFTDANNKKDLSTSEVVTFFTSLFDSKPTLTDTSSSELFDFERKVAAGKYDKYARNIVTDLGEFVSDTMKLKS